jgi:hypothetical protein
VLLLFGVRRRAEPGNVIFFRDGKAALDHLLVISVERVSASVTAVRTVWATTDDILAGHRRTDLELVADEPALLIRLGELAPLIYRADLRAAAA